MMASITLLVAASLLLAAVVPPPLTGRWVLREALSTSYNPGTGGFAPVDGRIYELALTPQGQFQWNRFIQGTIRSCTRYSLQRLEGTFVVAGNNATFRPTRARESFRSRGGCASSRDYDRDISTAPFTHVWEVRRGTYGGDLNLILSGGNIYLSDVYTAVR
jgi:hypothetical protein